MLIFANKILYKMLTQEEADKILSIPKVIVNKGKAIKLFVLDFTTARDFRIGLSPSDSIDMNAEYLLNIRVSEKTRAKITLHTHENETHYCVFRLDYNGAPHKNPEYVSVDVPNKFKPFAGKTIGGTHVHYHVYGYPTAAWALPIEEDDFPVKKLTIDNFFNEFKDILQSMSEVIHLESKITFEGKIMFDNGMD